MRRMCLLCFYRAGLARRAGYTKIAFKKELEKREKMCYAFYMKRVFFDCMLVLCALLFWGCASTKIDLMDYEPLAIVTVSSNSTVPWYVDDRDKTSETDGETGGALTGALNRAMGANNPEIQRANERVDYAADALVTLLSRNTISVVDPSVVQEAPTVKAQGNGILSHLEDSFVAEGYKKLSPSGAKRNRMICEETSANSLLFADFLFQKQKINVGLTDLAAAARVTLTVYLTDSSGRKVLEKLYSAVSAEHTPYKNGKWDKEALCSYFDSAIDSVVNQFIFDCMGGAAQVEGAQNTESLQGTTISISRPKSAVQEQAGEEERAQDAEPPLAEKE